MRTTAVVSRHVVVFGEAVVTSPPKIQTMYEPLESSVRSVVLAALRSQTVSLTEGEQSPFTVMEHNAVTDITLSFYWIPASLSDYECNLCSMK